MKGRHTRWNPEAAAGLGNDPTVIGNGNDTFWSKWWRDGSPDPKIRQDDFVARHDAGRSSPIPDLFLIPEARRNMPQREPSPLLLAMIGQVVVVDLRSTYVCLGTLAGGDEQYLEMLDADFHD